MTPAERTRQDIKEVLSKTGWAFVILFFAVVLFIMVKAI